MEAKKIAAEKAVEFIKDGMLVGLGTGSTAYWAIKRIGQRIKEEALQIKAIATSQQSENLAKELGIPLVSFAEVQKLDVTIDGADEVDGSRNLIKGGGGALLREKIVAFHSETFIVIVDEAKVVERLGKFPLPVEIVPFGFEATVRAIQQIGGTPTLRLTDGKPFITDNGNLIADCAFYPIENPVHLNEQLHQIPGVVETGLFPSAMVNTVIVGAANGSVRVLQ